MTVIWMRPTSGNLFPLSAAAIGVDSGGTGPAGTYVVSRKPGFASNSIFALRRYSPSMYGPVPTGCAPKSAPYTSTTSRATAAVFGTANA